jgi:hypothetical protein
LGQDAPVSETLIRGLYNYGIDSYQNLNLEQYNYGIDSYQNLNLEQYNYGIDSYQSGNDYRYIALRASNLKVQPKS